MLKIHKFMCTYEQQRMTPSLWWLVTDDLMAYRRQHSSEFYGVSDFVGCHITELISNTNILKLN